jgi:hypothetical protein
MPERPRDLRSRTKDSGVMTCDEPTHEGKKKKG